MQRVPPLGSQTSSRQLSLFGLATNSLPTVERLVTDVENQWFDRKSPRIAANELANCLIGMANADGGRVVIGIENKLIKGIASSKKLFNDWLQAGRDFAEPPVRHTHYLIECQNEAGQPDQLLVLDVEASETVHRNQKGECYLRVGDETRRLRTTEEQHLVFDKSEGAFDKSIVPDLTLDDLDTGAMKAYAVHAEARDPAALFRSRGLYYDQGSRRGVTQAGLLLFGITPPIWSYIRYVRYDGATIETGTRSNLRADIRLEGTLPVLLTSAQALLRVEIGTTIRLLPDGRFGQVPTLPEFAWLEAVVNAVTHRSYALHGDGIHVRQFSDRLEIQSPGRLPGLIRVSNIRHSRFARNAHIARVLAELTSYVREQNEGVPRMYDEMRAANLREPEYRISDSSVTVILYKEVANTGPTPPQAIPAVVEARRLLGARGQKHLLPLLELFADQRSQTTAEAAVALNLSRFTVSKYLTILAEQKLIRFDAQSPTDPRARWVATDSLDWHQVVQLLRQAPA